MEMDSGSDSDDSSVSANSDYSQHSQEAAVEALQRALSHAAHVQTMMDNEDDSSTGDMSQDFTATTTTSTSQAVPRETKQLANMEVEPTPQIVVCPSL